MQPINLTEFRDGVRGRTYRQLVEHHLKNQVGDERMKAILGTVELLPKPVRPPAEELIDRWNARAYNADFWSRDCADVFDEIAADAEALFESNGLEADDEDVFNVFQVVTMSFAYSAEKEPRFREFAGIEGKTGGGWGLPVAMGVGLILLMNVTDNPVLLIGAWLVFGVVVFPVVVKFLT